MIVEDARQRRADTAEARARLDELAAERRLAAEHRHERANLTLRNIALGFRNAAREMRRLWVTR